jgi:hypothetical protein
MGCGITSYELLPFSWATHSPKEQERWARRFHWRHVFCRCDCVTWRVFPNPACGIHPECKDAGRAPGLDASLAATDSWEAGTLVQLARSQRYNLSTPLQAGEGRILAPGDHRCDSQDWLQASMMPMTSPMAGSSGGELSLLSRIFKVLYHHKTLKERTKH